LEFRLQAAISRSQRPSEDGTPNFPFGTLLAKSTANYELQNEPEELDHGIDSACFANSFAVRRGAGVAV